MNNIFVGNLSFVSTKEEVTKLFEPFGTVANVVIMERKKGKSRGFGFVDMPNEAEKAAAIAALNGKEFMWRVLVVSELMPRKPGEPRPKKVRLAKEGRESKPFKSPRASDAGRTPYKKLDGSSKPWVKKEGVSKRTTKPGGGFKMAHKVVGTPKSRPKRGLVRPL